MRVARTLVVAAAVACTPRSTIPHTRAVPLAAGARQVVFDTPGVTRHVILELASDGRATATTYEESSGSDDDGGLARLDREQVERRGRWTADGDVELAVTRACRWGFGERECAHPSPGHRPWRLRCQATVPAAGSPLPAPALVCAFVEGAPEPRFTVALAGRRYLVVGDWLRYRRGAAPAPPASAGQVAAAGAVVAVRSARRAQVRALALRGSSRAPEFAAIRRTLAEARRRFDSCDGDGDPPGWARCACQVLCRLRFPAAPPGTSRTIRYPEAEVGGLHFDLDARGAPLRCGYRGLGPEPRVQVALDCP